MRARIDDGRRPLARRHVHQRLGHGALRLRWIDKTDMLNEFIARVLAARTR